MKTEAVLPQVTTVMVCWNHEAFVRQAVLSVLDQTLPSHQVIVFDNGSTDGSRGVLEALRRERDFTLICQDNIGLVPALNRGLAMAEGQYFQCLATDDAMLPDKTERQVRYLEANPDVHLVCGQVDVIDEHGRPGGWPATRRPGEVTFDDLMRNGCNVSGPTILCRTDTLRAIGGYDEQALIEDYSLALRLTHMGYRAVCLDEVVTHYRRHGGNWTTRPIWEERRRVGQPYRRTPQYRDFARCNLAGYFRHLAGRRKREALQLLWQEPFVWSWRELGIGLMKLALPASLQQRSNRQGQRA
jgi:alpha-1,3-rhamnosyltransferase